MNWAQYLMLKKDLEETKQYLALLAPEMHASDKEEDMFATKRLSENGELEFVANYGGDFSGKVVMYNGGGTKTIKLSMYVNGDKKSNWTFLSSTSVVPSFSAPKVNKNDQIKFVCEANPAGAPNLDIRVDLYASVTKVASDIK